MEILIGPPGSGKTRLILERFRSALGSGSAPLLLAPTATMGEHLRNQLAREGHVFRPSAITTLSKFIHQAARDREPATTARLALAVDDRLGQTQLDAFAPVSGFAGFRSMLVRAIEELSAAGCDAARLQQHARGDSYGEELARIYEAVEEYARAQGWHLRPARLAYAAERIRESGAGPAKEVFAAGFYSFTEGEMDVLQAIAGHARLTLALPEWTGSERCIARLGQCARITKLEPAPALTEFVLVRPSTPEQEANEVARRILAEYRAGRPFREMGVIMRSEQPFGPAIRTALRRFSIPARFYFGQRLADHDSIRMLSSCVEAMLGGWEHGALLTAVRLDGSPIGGSGGDRFEHEVLERLPGRGLAEFENIAGERYPEFFAVLKQMDTWPAESAKASRWAQRLEHLTRLCAPQQIRDGTDEEYVEIWRGHAAALKLWAAAMDEASEALGREQTMRIETFWKMARIILEETTLRVNDHRRDVVHVMDAFEARQWKLPVVFLPNLLEKHFPRYHVQDSVLSESLRLRLQKAGFEIRTASDRQRDEEFLFDTAVQRGTAKVVLSAPRINEKGGDTLPSFFLQKIPFQEEKPVTVRPVSHWPEARRGSGVNDPEMLDRIRTLTQTLSVSKIEQYLQCPFKYFSADLLRLRPAPVAPAQRLNIMEQGNIAHKVLELWAIEGRAVDELLERELAQKLIDLRVPHGYRAEAIRMELSTHLQNYVRDTPITRGTLLHAEKELKLTLADGTVISGRIDRVDRAPSGGAVVVDYKYSTRPAIIGLIEGHLQGRNVQTGLYLHQLLVDGHRPAGMFYAGLRNEITVRGWGHELGDYISGGVEQGSLEEMMQSSLQRTEAALARLRTGITAPQPADESKCRYCDFRHACRVDAAVTAAAEAAE